IRDFHVTGVQTCALPISPIADRFHVTTSQSDRATTVDELARIARSVAPRGAVIEYLVFEEAVEAARAWAADGPSRAVLITGSIRSEERRVGKERRALWTA